MLSYTELLKPTVVTHAAVLPNAYNIAGVVQDLLVVVRGDSLLQCFTGIGTNLKWVCEFALQGTVQEVASVGDRLLVSFASAKLVFLRWNNDELKFDTESLHFYENELSGSKTAHKLLVSSQHGLAGLWVSPHLLAVVNFGHESESLADLWTEKHDAFTKTMSLDLAPQLLSLANASQVVDMAFAKYLTVPTLAVLAWEIPSWAGLAHIQGQNTKVLVSMPLCKSLRTLQITKLPYDITRILALEGVSNRLMLLIGSRNLYYLDEANDVIPFAGCEYDFANCVATQLQNWAFIVLSSGDALALNLVTGSAELLPEWLKGSATTIAAFEKFLIIGNRDGSALICKWTCTGAQTETTEFREIENLEELYTSTSQPETETFSVDIVHELIGYGSLSAVATITNGLACGSNRGILIAERELTLVEKDLVMLDREVEPGSFWLPQGEVLVSSYVEISELTPKRQKREKVEMAVTEVVALRSGKALKLDIPHDETTLAVYENGETMWVVQKRKIFKFLLKELVATQEIEECDFADVSMARLMTYTSSSGRCSLYDPESLQRVSFTDQQDTGTISSTLFVSSQGKVLRVQSLASNESNLYDASNLDLFLSPVDEFVIGDERAAYLSLYALRFNATDYIGVQIERTFVIYEVIGERLVKRFTMPFAVNQSPVFLPNVEALVFPGKKTHILVKDKEAAFTYHRLALDAALMDVIPLQGSRFAWLDDRDCLHFSELDETLDIHSNTLPLRFAELGVPVKTVAFHEGSNSIVVGANLPTDFVPERAHEEELEEDAKEDANNVAELDDAAPEDEDAEQDDEPEDKAGQARDEVIDEMAESEVPAPTFRGRVYFLSLDTLQFERVAEYDEALMSMCMVDYDEPQCPQVLAVGTAALTIESAETNGHLYLYKLPPLSLLAEEHLRGSVSSMTVALRDLAVAHGNQIHIYKLHGHSKLDPVAFFNTDVYVQDLKAVRNVLGMGERLRAARLVNYATTPHRTDMLASADFDTRMETAAIEFVSSAARGDLSLVCAGLDRRLQVFQYDPENLESNGGSRLVPLADFYSGRQVVALCAAQLYNNSDIVAYGVAADGTLFTIRPLNEEMYRTFHILLHHLMERERSEAGLNPKMFHVSPQWGANLANKLLDLNFAQRFWSLTLEQQEACGRILGFKGISRAQRALSVEGRDLLKL